MKKLSNISKQQISSMGVQALADRPNSMSKYGTGGLSAPELKLWFDKLAIFLAEKLNVLQDALASEDAADYIRISLDDFGVESLKDLVESFKNGEFANKVLHLSSSASTSEKETLQSIVNKIAETLSTTKEKIENIWDKCGTSIVVQTSEDDTIQFDLLNEAEETISSQRTDILAVHNSSEFSHSDIRKQVSSISLKLENFLGETNGDLASTIAQHNVSEESHKDIRDILSATTQTANDGSSKADEVAVKLDDFIKDVSVNLPFAISTHNTSEEAHNDIRILLKELKESVAAFHDIDDETLDQASEVIALIKSNKSVIDTITTSKVNVSDIIDNLVTSLSDKPLSAKQGVELKKIIDTLAIANAENISESNFLTIDKSTRTLKDSGKNADSFVTRYVNPDTTMKLYAAGSNADPVDKMLFVKTGFVGTEGVDTVALRGDKKDPKHPGTFEIQHPQTNEYLEDGITLNPAYSLKHPLTLGTGDERYVKRYKAENYTHRRVYVNDRGTESTIIVINDISDNSENNANAGNTSFSTYTVACRNKYGGLTVTSPRDKYDAVNKKTLDAEIAKFTDGSVTVKKAEQDANGNNIHDTYVDKVAYDAKVAELVAKYEALGKEINNLVLGQIPIATYDTAGIVKPDGIIRIDDNGVLSIPHASYDHENLGEYEALDGIITAEQYDTLYKTIFNNVFTFANNNLNGDQYDDYLIYNVYTANCAAGLTDKPLKQYIEGIQADITKLNNKDTVSVLSANLIRYDYTGYELENWYDVKLMTNGVYLIQYDTVSGVLVNRVDSDDDKPGVALGKYVAYYDTQAERITITEDGLPVSEPKPIYIMRLAQATILS